jgi:MerR family transcriptional regulator, light-induced transcriptional regulator
MASDTRLRIGEVGRRAGVSPELLRAWERRYGLLRPVRSPGGLRLYSIEDLARVRLMKEYLASGLAAAEAAALASSVTLDEEGSAPEPAFAPEAACRELAGALGGFDEPGAQALLDRLLAVATPDAVLAEVVLPYLRELGERWERGEASVAEEHFATSVLRGRMLGLARGWGRGVGPLALLACLPDERHELGLLAFGLALRSRGWRNGYFGADTPIETVVQATELLEPALVVLSSVTSERVDPVTEQLRSIARRHRLALAGEGAVGAEERVRGVIVLTGDPVTEAERVTELVRPPEGR